MDTLPCAYCSDDATGIDEDDEHTCGACMPVVGPLPAVIEVSGEDTGEEEPDEDGESHEGTEDEDA